jgi:hypothetical protein
MLSTAPVLAATGDTPKTTTGPAGETIKNTGKPPTTRTDNAQPSAGQAEHSGVGGGAPGAMQARDGGRAGSTWVCIGRIPSAAPVKRTALPAPLRHHEFWSGDTNELRRARTVCV